jgi:protoporphyrinogen/coproporphyrinogen III oxidase
MMRVAVIGGGMAGLSAAWELLRAGQDPIVFEAAPRAGGKVSSVREGGWLTEDGPHFVAQPLDGLLEDAGLRGQLLEPLPPKTRWVWLREQKLRAPSLKLLGQIGVPRALLEPLFSKPLQADEPLRDFLIDRLGAKAGALASTLLSSGVYAGDPSRLSALTAFPTLSRGSLLLRRGKRPPIWSLRDGLGSLPLALAARLGERVRAGTPVKKLEPSSTGWLVDGASFDAVVLAVPATAAAKLLPRLADKLVAFHAAPVTLVHLGYPSGELPRGFGLLDASDSLRFLGALFPSSMLPGRAPEGSALLTAICGGARHPEIANLPDAALTEAVREDVKRALGVRSDPGYLRVVRYAEGIPQVEVGHAERLKELRNLASELPRLALAGAAYDGVSVPDVVRSGLAAASALICDLHRSSRRVDQA